MTLKAAFQRHTPANRLRVRSSVIMEDTKKLLRPTSERRQRRLINEPRGCSTPGPRPKQDARLAHRRRVKEAVWNLRLSVQRRRFSLPAGTSLLWLLATAEAHSRCGLSTSRLLSRDSAPSAIAAENPAKSPQRSRHAHAESSRTAEEIKMMLKC